ncbi:hypothetical protein K2Y11_23575 [bacterium]|nr:hypothetical protein [bacterium]
MIHYTCDMCCRDITDNESRHVVFIELRPAESALEITEEDIEEDNLHQISEALKEMEARGEEYLDAAAPKKFRFDLCDECRDQFAKNPLAHAVMPKLNFSEN